MQEMMKMYSMYGMAANMFNEQNLSLILNANHPLVKAVSEDPEGENTPVICEQLYDLAALSHGPLSPERLTKFIARSNEILLKIGK